MNVPFTSTFVCFNADSIVTKLLLSAAEIWRSQRCRSAAATANMNHYKGGFALMFIGDSFDSPCTLPTWERENLTPSRCGGVTWNNPTLSGTRIRQIGTSAQSEVSLPEVWGCLSLLWIYLLIRIVKCFNFTSIYIEPDRERQNNNAFFILQKQH